MRPLGLAGLLALILGHPTGPRLRPVAGSLLVVAAIVVVFGPWWLSLVRDLLAERQARALAEERAQMAAHVHDSVLQTLALIQRVADDPQHVVRLARAQERELRSWLFDGRLPGTIGAEATTLAEGSSSSSARSRPTTGSPSRWWWSGTARSTTASGRCWRRPARPRSTRPSGRGPPEVSIYAEVEPEHRRSTCATGAAASTPPTFPPTARASPGRSGPGWPGSGAQRSRSAPGRGHRGAALAAAGASGRAMSTGRDPRVFLVDDHAMFRAGVRAELGDAVEVVGEADEATPRSR